MKEKLILKAIEFAEIAHTGQTRKWTGIPYILHPIEVARIVYAIYSDDEISAAAVLHDVVEDTDVTLDEVQESFGGRVAQLVSEVTKASNKADGTRAVRKQIDLDHYAKASSEGQSIKLADIISNSVDVVEHDTNFAKVYIPEQMKLAQALTKGNPQLRTIALMILDQKAQHLQRILATK